MYSSTTVHDAFDLWVLIAKWRVAQPAAGKAPVRSESKPRPPPLSLAQVCAGTRNERMQGLIAPTYGILVSRVAAAAASFFLLDGGRPRAVGVADSPLFARTASVSAPGGQNFSFGADFEDDDPSEADVRAAGGGWRMLLSIAPTWLKSFLNLSRLACKATSSPLSSASISS